MYGVNTALTMRRTVIYGWQLAIGCDDHTYDDDCIVVYLVIFR